MEEIILETPYRAYINCKTGKKEGKYTKIDDAIKQLKYFVKKFIEKEGIIVENDAVQFQALYPNSNHPAVRIIINDQRIKKDEILKIAKYFGFDYFLPSS